MVDIQTLLQQPPVAKALADLQSLSSRPLEVKRVDPTDPESPDRTAYVRSDHEDQIYLEDEVPEHLLIHEIIHPILWAEGYPSLVVKKSKGLSFSNEQKKEFEGLLDGIRNVLEHHEVHRRMEAVYGLNMRPYYEYKGRQHTGQLEQLAKPRQRLIGVYVQKEMIDILEMLEYREFLEPALKLYDRSMLSVIPRCEQLFQRVKATGFSTPAQARQSYYLIRDHVIEFGQNVLKIPKRENDLWRDLSFPLGSNE